MFLIVLFSVLLKFCRRGAPPLPDGSRSGAVSVLSRSMMRMRATAIIIAGREYLRNAMLGIGLPEAGIMSP